MAKRRPSGDGMVRKREDGRWEGRIVIGHKEKGGRLVTGDTKTYAGTRTIVLPGQHCGIAAVPQKEFLLRLDFP